ncbi:MAG TPA: PhoH family protein, partial [bacterium (Candidatus Stahlbacteria)]|nr:PhoH family protein [Candidatus Stahlbacteria bacterium]
PLYDALYEIMPKSKVNELIKDKVIEIAPLAYMRGRNLNNSFIILDEAQNTTKVQMKMFLTRMGINSKACITGDITQIDLKDTKDSGLLHIKTILQDIPGIKFVHLGERDCVRHKIVKAILKAYEKVEENNN